MKILHESGCEVDFKTELVKFPQSLVGEMVKKTPNSIILCGRTPDCDLRMEDCRAYFAGGANAVEIFDFKTFGARDATVKDSMDLTVISDALENVHCYLAVVWPQDVPPVGVDRVKCEIAFRNTTKHFLPTQRGERMLRIRSRWLRRLSVEKMN